MEIITFVIAALLTSGAAISAPVAIDVQMGDDIAPGHALYGLEKAGESIREVFIISPYEKAKFNVERADERLDEVEEIKDTKPEAISDLITEYRERIQTSIDCADEVNGSDRQRIHSRILERLQIHTAVLEGLALTVPSEAVGAINTAIASSSNARNVVQSRIP